MTLKLNEKFLGSLLSAADMEAISGEADRAFETVCRRNGPGNEFLGWIDLPVAYDKEEFRRIQAAAEKIQKSCDIFVVLGIGGSYLGTRAAIEFMRSPLYNDLKKDTPSVYYAGNHISTAALQELFSVCEGHDVCINVVSKSGTTTETAIAFRLFRQWLVNKYGAKGAAERIFATTDRHHGTLREAAKRKGYETFVIPDDIGGRFSVLTAVGLLPMAVAGIDIVEVMAGAVAAREASLQPGVGHNTALRYAALRNLLYRKGRAVEMLVGYEPYLQMLTEWWKQLFGESEGKDGQGILPHAVIFSTDLHSLGQYIQEGAPILFETVLHIRDNDRVLRLQATTDDEEGLNYLAGKTLSEVNETAMLGTLFAHMDGGVPNLVLEVSERSAHAFGYLVYFFEIACAFSGYLLGVNPFNQPGVDSYKTNMFALLGKQGYEAKREALLERIQ
ncbi:MAG: glucose-6-phosphate isomerase [Eubacteriales bacterium]